MTRSSTAHPVRYRAGQFFVALKAYVVGSTTSQDPALVNSILPLPARQLFERMPPNDQRHALAVTETLKQADCTDPALLQAALLHDVAKSISQPLPYRVLIVLLEAFWPTVLQQLSAVGSHELDAPEAKLHTIPRWRRPFGVHALHPAIGAAWAKEAGCEPLAVWLIANHQDEINPENGILSPEQELLRVLQWADGKN